MDNKIEDTEADLKAQSETLGKGAEAEKDQIQDDNDVDLFEKSYFDDNNKKPPFIFIAIITLLILFVFVKKFMASRVEYPPIQELEKIIKNDLQKK